MTNQTVGNIFWKHALKFGLIFGLTYISLMFITYSLGLSPLSITYTFLNFFIIIIGLFTLSYCMNNKGCSLSFKKGMTLGLIFLVAYALTTSLWHFILSNVIYPNLYEEAVNNEMKILEESGIEKMEIILFKESKLSIYNNNLVMFLTNITSTLFIGSLLNLLPSFYFRNRNEPTH